MATAAQQKAFIEAIGPIIQKIGPKYNIVCPSAVIGQACLESAYGTSSKAAHHNYFGLKYRANRVSCHSGYFKDGSKEERAGGHIENITDYWYAFADMEHGVEGYCQFVNISNYSNVKGVKDPQTYLTNIRKDGYATSSSYVTNVMSVIRSHNLTRFDVPDTNVGKKEEAKVSLNIIKNTNFRHHNTSVRKCRPEYIVIHYTASVADAASQIAYFNGTGANSSSADFFVAWDGRIYQYNMDIKGRYSWAVGGGRQSNYGGNFLGRCTNSNSISIEMCCKSKTGKYSGANSSNWYFTDETVSAAVRLVQMLMAEYGIDADHVIRHYDVNGKICPGIIGWNYPSGSDKKWYAFKDAVKADFVPVKAEETVAGETSTYKAESPYLVKIGIRTLRIRKGPGTNYGIVKFIMPGIYTIVETQGNWGRLKSGAGWICLDYARRV